MVYYGHEAWFANAVKWTISKRESARFKRGSVCPQLIREEPAIDQGDLGLRQNRLIEMRDSRGLEGFSKDITKLE